MPLISVNIFEVWIWSLQHGSNKFGRRQKKKKKKLWSQWSLGLQQTITLQLITFSISRWVVWFAKMMQNGANKIFNCLVLFSPDPRSILNYCRTKENQNISTFRKASLEHLDLISFPKTSGEYFWCVSLKESSWKLDQRRRGNEQQMLGGGYRSSREGFIVNSRCQTNPTPSFYVRLLESKDIQTSDWRKHGY